MCKDLRPRWNSPLESIPVRYYFFLPAPPSRCSRRGAKPTLLCLFPVCLICFFISSFRIPLIQPLGNPLNVGGETSLILILAKEKARKRNLFWAMLCVAWEREDSNLQPFRQSRTLYLWATLPRLTLGTVNSKANSEVFVKRKGPPRITHRVINRRGAHLSSDYKSEGAPYSPWQRAHTAKDIPVYSPTDRETSSRREQLKIAAIFKW